MRLILSRKGFDSAAGGIPNPILPTGELFPLPIPYKFGAPVRYRDLRPPPGTEPRFADLGEFVSHFGAAWGTPRMRIGPDTLAHVDPDLVAGTRPRAPDWRPLFGQCGAALGHLERQGVRSGDLFLFFGRFDHLIMDGLNGWRFQGRPFHTLFGWLQVGQVHHLPSRNLPAWAADHPHVHARDDWPRPNALFEAAERLSIAGMAADLPGAGLFPRYHDQLRLTAPDTQSLSEWLVPSWFAPQSEAHGPTYLSDERRWRASQNGKIVDASGRWQESVLDLGERPEAMTWLSALFGAKGKDSASDRAPRPSTSGTSEACESGAASRSLAPPQAELREPRPSPLPSDVGRRVLVISPSHGSRSDRQRAWQAMAVGGYVAIGFVHHDFTGLDRSQFERIFAEDVEPRAARLALLPQAFKADWARKQVAKFIFDLEAGDLVIVKDGAQGIFGAGLLRSGYRYEEQAHPTTGRRWEAYSHLRDVEWLTTRYRPIDGFAARCPWNPRTTLSVIDDREDRPWVASYLRAVRLQL